MKEQLTNERPCFKSRKTDEGIQVAVALPGVPRESLELNIEKRVLTITGERQAPADFEALDGEARKYELKLELHEDLDVQVIGASYQDGLLKLQLNKRQELAPRKIDILAN